MQKARWSRIVHSGSKRQCHSNCAWQACSCGVLGYWPILQRLRRLHQHAHNCKQHSRRKSAWKMGPSQICQRIHHDQLGMYLLPCSNSVPSRDHAALGSISELGGRVSLWTRSLTLALWSPTTLSSLYLLILRCFFHVSPNRSMPAYLQVSSSLASMSGLVFDFTCKG